MKQGEIWQVSFSGEGHEYQGRRPALIIQSNKQLKVTTVVSVIPFTSRIDKRYADDIFVSKSTENKLYHDSLIKVHHIQTFDKVRFIKKVGELEPAILFEVQSYLQKHFGI
jgi:mRNA interferase MazF